MQIAEHSADDSITARETQDRQGRVRLLSLSGAELILDQPEFGSQILEFHLSPKAQLASDCAWNLALILPCGSGDVGSVL
jgi:hypothetical protein